MSTENKKPTGHVTGWKKLSRFLTNVLLFLASPFIALSYLVALPVAGFFYFTRGAGKKTRADG